VRTRGETDDNTSPVNFGGTFTFAGGLAPELNAENQEVLDGSGQPMMEPITSIQQYQRALLGLPGGGATQFSIAAGNPFLAVGQADVGAYVGDDWRVRPNVTLSLGLRYEMQTNIHDSRDFAPRFGFAWAPGIQHHRPASEVRDSRRIRHVLLPLRYLQHRDRRTLQRNRAAGVHRQQSDFLPHRPDHRATAGDAGRSVHADHSGTQFHIARAVYHAIGGDRGTPGGAQYHGLGDLHELARAAHAALGGIQRARAGLSDGVFRTL
jgi:hypothetical protein